MTETLLETVSGWPLVPLGVMLALAGLALRATGRRRAELAAAALAGRRRLGDVTAGPCTVEGHLRPLDDGQALVEDEAGAAVLVAWDAPPPSLPAGARVLVVGVAGGDAPDPRAAGYRGSGRVARLAVVGRDAFVTADLGRLDRTLVAARRAALAGGALFAGGLGLALAAVVVALRSASL
jgi:hypothetical protein